MSCHVLSGFHTPRQDLNEQMLQGDKNSCKERIYFNAFLSCLAFGPLNTGNSDCSLILSNYFTFYFIQLSQFFNTRVILIQTTPSQPEIKILFKFFFFFKKCTRWHIFLFNENVFLLALNKKDNLTQNKILSSQTSFPQNSVHVAPHSFCI